MRNWNKTGKIKALILGILFLPNIIIPIGAASGFNIAMIIMPLIFGIVVIPIITKVNAAIFGQLIEKPSWNDNPLTLKRPLVLFHFAAFFFLTTGLSIITGTAIAFARLNLFGLTSISFGAGIFLGIKLVLRITKK